MSFRPGKILLTFCAIFQAVSPFIFDYNETHVKNPRWPPHARFHNGQTMSMGVCLSLATLYYTWRSASSNLAARDSLRTAAVFASIYWLTGLSAILYPGTSWVDPEFGEGHPQLFIFVPFLLFPTISYVIESNYCIVDSKKRD
ncbi:hypothetical protein INT43_007687 [Umbelopsis isabellina]|uniref:Uncharacterized protein n=1 Tax=Mortierella isabellina TaxID=91625 RepID=A0A8H7PN38_MORIS|nr:hypothetical protein INT43_007687 [Umbelopsis isabellina]